MISLRCFQVSAQTIIGDFGVQMDDVCDRNAKKCVLPLKLLVLVSMWVKETKIKGHMPDLIITTSVNISNVAIVDVVWSFFDSDLYVTHKPAVEFAVLWKNRKSFK